MQVKAWIKALRIRTLPLAVSGIVVGNAVAYYYGAFDSFIFKMSLYTALLLQILSNLANDYGDFQKGTDNENRVGPERALQSGAIQPKDMKTAMVIIGFFSLICGLLLVYYGLSDANPMAGLFFIGLGIVCIIAAVLYTVGKNAYGYKGLGDIMVFLFFGITAVAGSFYLQYKDILWQVLLPAGAIGFFAAGVLNMNNMRDVVNDEASGKITIPVRLGFRRSKVYHSFLMISGMVCACLFQWMYLPMAISWHLSGLAIVLVHLVIVWRIVDEKKFDGQLKLNVLATLVYAVLLSCVMFNKIKYMQPDFDSEDVFDLLRNIDFKNLKAEFVPYQLQFRRPGKTSRGTMTNRNIWLLKVYEKDFPELAGYGEAAPLAGLSIETPQQVEDGLIDVCVDINNYNDLLFGKLERIPSVQFALEQALLDLKNNGDKILFPSKFTSGQELIRTNGLIWMGEPDYMIDQINEKINGGFKCIKLKIGALDFEAEYKIIEQIRDVFGYYDLEIRLDANGAFNAEDALEMLDRLAPFEIHSIEQPIKAGQWQEMEELCQVSPIPIALDEECIGAVTKEEKEELLDQLSPAFVVLKPSLLGGFQQSEEWIELAEQRDISWWITSALESNLGLNAIAQWTFTKQNPIHQGLGTGQLFTNNFESPLYLDTENLMYDPSIPWKLNF